MSINSKMNPPRPPRKSTGGVDVQLAEFEYDLRHSLVFQLVININHEFWAEMGELSNEDIAMIEDVIDGSFMDLKHRYKNVPPVMDLLEHCRILIQNSVWVAMNVPRPFDHESHIEAVIHNILAVYNRVIYAPLRTEMIMANHNAHVLQRTWRHCIADPSHLACRRRLSREFDNLEIMES
jgi:hypothetical protein